MKIKKVTKYLTEEDLLDINIYFKDNKIIRFALNYRAIIKGKWEEIYRVDNFHGFSHEQKFWRSKRPLPLEEYGLTYYDIINKYTKRINEKYEKYKSYYRSRKAN